MSLLLGSVAAAASSLPVQRVVSPGGIVAWLVEDHSNQLLAVSVGFQGGSALDPDGKAGLAEMISALLNEGAGDLDSQSFQMQLIRSASELGFAAHMDDVTATMRTLTATRDAGLELLRLTLSAPRFDAEPLERVRGQIAAAIVGQANDPGAIATTTWWSTAFPDHPYGRDSLGTPQSLAAVTADDLRRFVSERFTRDNLHVGVVGDITAAELAPLLDRVFGGLPASATPFELPEAKMSAAAQGQVIVIERDIPQSIMAFAHDGIAYLDPDYYTALLVNHVLGGGGFEARLMKEIRIKRGLAYTVGTQLTALARGALIQGGAGTQNARVAETLQLVREEWRRMAAEGPSEQELAEAKTFLLGVYPLGFTGTMQTAEALVYAQLNGLDTDFGARRASLIEKVTLDDARRVARRLLDPDKLLITIVGKPEGVTSAMPSEDAGAAPGEDGSSGPEHPAVPENGHQQ